MNKSLTLLRDYGYRMEGKALIQKGIRGWTSDRIVGYFRDAFDACDYLCPIIQDEEFTRRHTTVI